MIEALDEISEIPFEVFWDKFMEVNPGNLESKVPDMYWLKVGENDDLLPLSYLYQRYKAQGYWLKMKEANRILAFEYLCKFGTDYKEPFKHLQHFDLPF
jgi:hypothetical protein